MGILHWTAGRYGVKGSRLSSANSLICRYNSARQVQWKQTRTSCYVVLSVYLRDSETSDIRTFLSCPLRVRPRSPLGDHPFFGKCSILRPVL